MSAATHTSAPGIHGAGGSRHCFLPRVEEAGRRSVLVVVCCCASPGMTRSERATTTSGRSQPLACLPAPFPRRECTLLSSRGCVVDSPLTRSIRVAASAARFDYLDRFFYLSTKRHFSLVVASSVRAFAAMLRLASVLLSVSVQSAVDALGTAPPR